MKAYLDIVRKILEEGVEKKVVFVGSLKDNGLISMYHASEMFVLFSEWEGFGIVVIEAMAAGKPVIVSNRGSLPYLVTNKKNGLIVKFKEKPPLNQWINGGFFVFDKKIFDYLGENDVLEKKPFEKLAKEKQISAYKFNGFWECMDTYKDTQLLNELWKKNKAPWKLWH